MDARASFARKNTARSPGLQVAVGHAASSVGGEQKGRCLKWGETPAPERPAPSHRPCQKTRLRPHTAPQRHRPKGEPPPCAGGQARAGARKRPRQRQSTAEDRPQAIEGVSGRAVVARSSRRRSLPRTRRCRETAPKPSAFAPQHEGERSTEARIEETADANRDKSVPRQIDNRQQRLEEEAMVLFI